MNVLFCSHVSLHIHLNIIIFFIVPKLRAMISIMTMYILYNNSVSACQFCSIYQDTHFPVLSVLIPYFASRQTCLLYFNSSPLNRIESIFLDRNIRRITTLSTQNNISSQVNHFYIRAMALGSSCDTKEKKKKEPVLSEKNFTANLLT